MRTRRAEPEFEMQAALFTWARLPTVQAKYRGIDLLEGSMNGVKLSAAQAGKAKAAGMLKGAHDVTLPVARGGFIGLSIELKAGKNMPTNEQKDYANRLLDEGWKVLFIWDDWTLAKGEIEAYLALPAVSGSISRPTKQERQ